MKAISTKILPATRTKPARIKAYDCDGNYEIISEGEMENHGLSSLYTERAAKYVADELKIAMGWKGELISGWTKQGYVFVFVK